MAKKIVTGNYVNDFYSCAKFGENPSMGDFWAKRWNITQNVFYLYNFFKKHTHRSDRSPDLHAEWLKRRGLTQGRGFLALIDMAAHLLLLLCVIF